jgi:hypothetical protein
MAALAGGLAGGLLALAVVWYGQAAREARERACWRNWYREGRAHG